MENKFKPSPLEQMQKINLFSEMLRNARGAKYPREIAEAIGIKKFTVDAWENATGFPDPAKVDLTYLKKIAEVYGIPFDKFLSTLTTSLEARNAEKKSAIKVDRKSER